MYCEKRTNKQDWFYMQLGTKKALLHWVFPNQVLRVHKDRHDSKSRKIVFYTYYTVTYYMDPETAKFIRLR